MSLNDCVQNIGTKQLEIGEQIMKSKQKLNSDVSNEPEAKVLRRSLPGGVSLCYLSSSRSVDDLNSIVISIFQMEQHIIIRECLIHKVIRTLVEVFIKVLQFCFVCFAMHCQIGRAGMPIHPCAEEFNIYEAVKEIKRLFKQKTLRLLFKCDELNSRFSLKKDHIVKCTRQKNTVGK